MLEAGQDPLDLIRRHVTGDWSELDEHEQAENRFSIKELAQNVGGHFL